MNDEIRIINGIEFKVVDLKESINILVEGINTAYENCYKEGLINEAMSHEEMAEITSRWAGQHVLLSEEESK